MGHWYGIVLTMVNRCTAQIEALSSNGKSINDITVDLQNGVTDLLGQNLTSSYDAK